MPQRDQQNPYAASHSGHTHHQFSIFFRLIFDASLLAISGSVMRKARRILPSRSGCTHSYCWAGLPYLAKTSIFPVSGAEQFVASDADICLPRYSAMRPYSRLENPALMIGKWALGKNMFHKPSLLAFSFSSILGAWVLYLVLVWSSCADKT